MTDSHSGGSRTNDTETWAEGLYAPEPPALARARELASHRGIPPIALGPAEGKLIELLLRLAGARRVVEVGTLFGYSAMWIARALPEDGHLWTCEVDPDHARAAREVVAAAGLTGKVTVVLGPALQTLPTLEAHGPFDAVFVDADKAAYPAYLDWAEVHLRTGGLVLGDNAYAFGRLHLDPEDLDEEQRPGLEGIRTFNRRLADPDRWIGVMVPTGEGLAVAMKR